MEENENQQHGNEAAVTSKRTRTGFLIALGWILAVASLIIYPYFIFGLVGVIMGILATKGGSKSGVAVIAANIILMGIGLIYGGVISNYIGRILGM